MDWRSKADKGMRMPRVVGRVVDEWDENDDRSRVQPKGVGGDADDPERIKGVGGLAGISENVGGRSGVT